MAPLHGSTLTDCDDGVVTAKTGTVRGPLPDGEAPPAIVSPADLTHGDGREMAIRPHPVQQIATPSTVDDKFDLARLRLSQDFTGAGAKKLLTTVPVRKPNRQSFIRVRPGENWLLETAVLELKEDRETYLVDPSLWQELGPEISPRIIFTAIDRAGVLFLWPVRLPGPDGRQDAWSRSAITAAQTAMSQWTRIVANMGLGAYELYAATADIPEPEWPELSFQAIIKIAFRDKFINSIDDPVLRRLRGQS
jgi:hypothetical protein